MGRLDVERVPYEDYSNRQLAAIPLAVLFLALVILAGAYVLTGTPVDLGMAFTGGTEMRFDAGGDSLSEVRETFSGIETDSIRSSRGIGGGSSYLLQTQATKTGEIETIAEEAGYEVVQIQDRSAEFGADTQQQALLGIGIAFLGMSILVALMFRTLVPSVAVIASAFSDIVVPVALMRVFGLELTLGSVAALLMLIGYSVDSDILLNNHILRRHGEFYESTFRAMRTGVSMTLTSIAAMMTMAVMSWYFEIGLMYNIALVLVFGLSMDLINTYMMNMSLLRWYKYEGVTR
jgi:preprotein translocase subunit SecF